MILHFVLISNIIPLPSRHIKINPLPAEIKWAALSKKSFSHV